MGDARRLDRTDLLQLEVGVTEVVEEALAPSEQARDDRELELVDQPGGHELLDDAGSAPDRHVLPGCRLPGLVERRLDPVRDEVEGRTAILLERLALAVGEDED